VVGVSVLQRGISDHHPIVVEFSNSRDICWNKSRFFKYEASWTKQKEHKEIIKKVWRVKQRDQDPWSIFHKKLSSCRSSLKQWVRKQTNPVEERIKSIEQELQHLQEQEQWELPAPEASLKDELHNLLEQEELKWKQRAKENWLRNGDRNSKFFHACANQKHGRSRISVITDKDGRSCESKEEIESAFVSYFQELFTGGANLEVAACTEVLECKVTEDMNQKLLAEFTLDEISVALNQMPPLKAPGPDGFSACFYQHNWATVHHEVCSVVLHFLNSGIMDARINRTHIALIPKNLSPVSVMDFRPISLCNVIYKLISKVLANRLKVVLPKIISPTQSAFIPGRLISDNILAAFETMHSMQTRMWGKTGYMGFKLDMSKAYDRVEWDFLETTMRRLGFDGKWVKLIMTCIRTVTYSVVVNGHPVGNIRPTRGIRQGDPISPYLFLICAEVLSALLHKAEQRGIISGVPTSPKGPRLSHLFFADDSMLFCRSNSVEWRRLFRILGTYEEGSGQKLNLNKTSIFFSRNTSVEKRQEILSLSGLTETHRIDKYLGLPSFVGKSRRLAFHDIIDKVTQRLENWKVKFLSQAGKEVLLKAVIQAIPTYCMGIFQLPIGLCKEINHLMQKFWWNHMSQSSKIHWMSWEKLSRSKAIGGLGFRDLVLFNKAMLAKQGWRILQEPSSLTAQILKAKYYPKNSFLQASLGSRPSFAWRSIANARPLLRKGLVWRVGNGKDIKVWGEQWLPTPTTYSVQSYPRIIDENAHVADLINVETQCWKADLIRSVFEEEEAKVIINIPLSPMLPSDRLIWRGTDNGIFTVRSAYHLGKELQDQEGGQCSKRQKGQEVWKSIWSMEVPNSVKLFMWKACNDLLPTKTNLFKRKVVEDPKCPCCTLEEETTFHVLWSCPAARDVWGSHLSAFQKCYCEGESFRALVEYCFGKMNKEDLELLAVLARRIWLRRNSLVFEGIFAHPDNVYNEGIISLGEFRRCKEKPGSDLSTRGSSSRQPSWCPPPSGVFKINWDASLSVEQGRLGIGVIVRDCNGACMGARSVTKQVKVDPKTAEVIAALYAVQFSKEMGFLDAVFEGDAAQVVKDINSAPPYGSRVGHFLENIHSEKRNFRSVRFVFIPRECNAAAHVLAKEASSKTVDICWLEETPRSVRDIVLREYVCP